MKKIIQLAAAGALVLALAACSQTGKTEEKLTPARLLEKSKTATEESLEAVHSHVVYDDYKVTVIDGDLENPEKEKTKYDMQIDAFLKPQKIKGDLVIQPRGIAPYKGQLYKKDDRVFVNDEHSKKWEESPSGSLEELFGTLVDRTVPALDLTIFEPFIDDFELKPIEYGYALHLNLDRHEVEEFKEQIPDIGPAVDGFRLVDKMELVITFNKKTNYVTSFKMSADMTSYKGGNSYRARQKMNAVYSYFNDVDDFTVPESIMP